MQDKNLPAVIFQSNPSLNIPPPQYTLGIWQGRSQGGGSWGARDPPFVSLFVSKQPTIFRWQFGEYPMYESVWPPLWKILAMPMFDIFSWKGGREFDELIFFLRTWHLITTHRGWGIWTLASISYYMTVQVSNSNRKIPDSWQTGWKALKACTSFALCLKVLKNHLYFSLGRGEFEQKFPKIQMPGLGGGGECLSFNLTGTLYDWLIKGDSFLTSWLPRGLPLTSKIVKGLRLTKESSRVQPCFRRRSAGSITCTAAGPSNRA